MAFVYLNPVIPARPRRMVNLLAIAIDITFDRTTRSRGCRCCSFPSLCAKLPWWIVFGLPNANFLKTRKLFIGNIIVTEPRIGPSQPFAYKQRVQILVTREANANYTPILIAIARFTSDGLIFNQTLETPGSVSATIPNAIRRRCASLIAFGCINSMQTDTHWANIYRVPVNDTRSAKNFS
jgi:hypothetical protein